MKPLFVGVVILLLCGLPAQAFNPPEDKAGPVALRIEGPAKVTATETPIPLHVALTSAAKEPIQGTLRLQCIDLWRIEPAEPKSFTLPAEGSARFDVNAVAGKGSYSALYPIHAVAEFEIGGAKQTAHAVLLIEAQLPDAPRPERAVIWQPLNVQPNSALSLLRVPVFRTVIQVFGEQPQTLAPGWNGSDGRTRANVYPDSRMARPDARDSLGIHPPWYQALAGTILVEYPLHLPESLPIHFQFANAIRDSASTESASDGVTFRVRVAPLDAPDGTFGDVLFEKHTDAKSWQDADVDLSRYAGNSIRLQIESHPGPKNDTTCDASYWADLVVTAGTPAASQQAALGAETRIGTGRRDGKDYTFSVQLGPRGLLDGLVKCSDGERTLSFQGFHVQVLGNAIEAPTGIPEVREVAAERTGRGYRVKHVLQVGSVQFDLLGELYVGEATGALHADFWLERVPDPKPWSVVYIEDLAAGPWSEHATQVYAGVGNVMREPQAFELGFDGHQLSTSFVGFDFANGVSIVQGVDVPPNKLEVTPDKRVYSLHAPLKQTMSFIPCPNVWDGVGVWRNDIDAKRTPAGGVKRLAGRFVFDLWGGGYASSARDLERMFRYGLTHSIVVWHNWQRWGYDYRLPDIYPPNPDCGTIEEFQALAKLCKDRGVLFSPHDNYIDFYPDAEGFTYKDVAFTRDGEPIRAWLNEGRGAQAYRWNTAAYRPFMERNLKLIRDNFAPTAYFIDVWSSIGPYESWTHDGQFQDRVFTRNTWGETFAWIRNYLGNDAPTISESGHDQLVGYLDGSQTNHLRVDPNPPKGGEWMVWRVTCADSERIPWFDAAHHGRFVAHGAGYEGRYLGGLDAGLHGINSDDYITSEVMTGHPPMVAPPFDHSMVRKYWLLHDLIESLAFKSIRRVEFADNDLHRQHIVWDAPANGADVWINRGTSDWSVPSGDTVILPPYGFYARVNDSGAVRSAGIVRKDGVIVESSNSGDDIHYYSARPVINGRLPVRVRAESVRSLPDRKLEVVFQWDAERPLAEDLNPFVHFVDAGGKILFQADHKFATPTTQWHGVIQSAPVCEIPKTLQSGDTVELRVGLWRPDLGQRPIQGFSDDQGRVRLGTLKIDGDSVAWTPLVAPPDPLLARMNPEKKMIDFGIVKTDGAVRITRDGSTHLLTPLPGCPAFTVRLDKKCAWLKDNALPRQAECLSEDGKALHAVPLKEEGDVFVLSCEPGVFAYRLIGGS